jgi:formate hydrogenlyase subunit 6/NADH:ubiquinone oxidoreductase subunit I
MPPALCSGDALNAWVFLVISIGLRLQFQSMAKKKLPKVLALLDEDMCTGCEACMTVCPVDCISTIPGHRHEAVFQVCTIDLPRCIGCTLCHQVCPWDCITMLPTDQFLQNANTVPQLE